MKQIDRVVHQPLLEIGRILAKAIQYGNVSCDNQFRDINQSFDTMVFGSGIQEWSLVFYIN